MRAEAAAADAPLLEVHLVAAARQQPERDGDDEEARDDDERDVHARRPLVSRGAVVERVEQRHAAGREDDPGDDPPEQEGQPEDERVHAVRERHAAQHRRAAGRPRASGTRAVGAAAPRSSVSPQQFARGGRADGCQSGP